MGWVAAGGGVLPAGSQDKPQASLQHDVTVTLKLIQVYVVDKDGKPVTDLKIGDFELWDDGKLKPLTDFEAHSLSIETEPAALPAPQAPAAPKVEKMTRKFFLFFDFAFNTLPGIRESKNTALKFLATQVRPDDEVGIMSYHARKGLIINEYLTTEHEKIRQAIKAIKPNAVMGRAADVGNESLKEMSETIKLFGDNEESAETLIQVEERQYEEQVKSYVYEMIQFADAMRYVPGLKNIVLFTSGIGHFLLYGSEQYQTSYKDVRTGHPAIRAAFQNMCKALAASNCPVYPVNVKGVSAETRKSEDRDLLGDSSLKALASESGGKYFDNVRSYEQIGAEIQNLTAAYYVLGYYINEKLDGDFHGVKVRVKRTGCEVHGQSGYFNPKPFTDYSENEKTLHLIDLALSEKPHLQEALDFPVSVLPYAAGEKTEYVVLAGIPSSKLSEVAGGKIEFITIVFDEKNDITLIQKKELSRWSRSAEIAYAKSLISLPPGVYECRVVLRNMTTGKGARGSSRMDVPEQTENIPLILLKPLILSSASAPIYLGEEESSKETRLWDIYPFDPDQYAPVMQLPVKGISGIRAVIPCLEPPADLNAITFSASAVDLSTADEVSVAVESTEWIRSGESRVASLKLATGALGPGEYALYLSAEAPGTGRRTVSAGSFKIE